MTQNKPFFQLPRVLVFTGEIFMVFLWSIVALWGVIFFAKGFFDLGNLFLIDRFYGFTFLLIGFFFLRHVFTYVVKVEGTPFLRHQFYECVRPLVSFSEGCWGHS